MQPLLNRSVERHQFLRRLLHLSLPCGRGLVVTAEAYFDESGTHDGSPITCLAGYILDSADCEILDLEWRSVLESLGLDCFHMSECAHRAGRFAGKTDSECDRGARALIEIIKRRASAGLIVTMCERDFNELKPVSWPSDLGPYSFCVEWCFLMAIAWSEQQHYNGSIAYFFEAGHHHQRQTNAGIDLLMQSPRFRENPGGYRSHSFIHKQDACALQAADILAWEWFQDSKRRMGVTNRQRRKSLSSILELQHIHSHFSRTDVGEFFRYGASGFKTLPPGPHITLLRP